MKYSLGFWIPRRGFQIPAIAFEIFSSGTWIPDSYSFIPDSKTQDSGFHEQKFPRLRILEAKISRIPESGFPYMGRTRANFAVLCPDNTGRSYIPC